VLGRHRGKGIRECGIDQRGEAGCVAKKKKICNRSYCGRTHELSSRIWIAAAAWASLWQAAMTEVANDSASWRRKFLNGEQNKEQALIDSNGLNALQLVEFVFCYLRAKGFRN
jgi:hypothetical protein